MRRYQRAQAILMWKCCRWSVVTSLEQAYQNAARAWQREVSQGRPFVEAFAHLAPPVVGPATVADEPSALTTSMRPSALFVTTRSVVRNDPFG